MPSPCIIAIQYTTIIHTSSTSLQARNNRELLPYYLFIARNTTSLISFLRNYILVIHRYTVSMYPADQKREAIERKPQSGIERAQYRGRGTGAQS